MAMSETQCHTATLLDMRGEGTEAILSQPCNALIDSPYLLRRLGSMSQIRYASNRGPSSPNNAAPITMEK